MSYVETVMGLPMSIDIRHDGDNAPIADAAFDELRRADTAFSTYRSDSVISRLNRGELAYDDVDDQFSDVVKLAERFVTVSGGAFAVRDSLDRLDMNGIVKGWAAQRAGELLQANGLHNFCINAGGDVIAAGHPEPGRSWQVGVRSPESAEQMLAVFGLSDLAIATSGSYERGNHIIDGRTGEIARGLSSVSVIAADLTTADVLATTVYAMGPDGVNWAAERYVCGILAVTEAGDLIDGGDVRRWLASEP